MADSNDFTSSEQAIHLAALRCRILRTLKKRMKQIDPRSVIQIASDRYPALFHTFRFGKIKPFTGGCHDGQVDLFYCRNPELQEEEPFPLWMILEATNITLALGEREYKTPSRAILKESGYSHR
jgi:hypothetical protein